VFTPFHKPPYTYPYGRSVDETMTSFPSHTARNMVLTVHRFFGARRTRTTCEKEDRIAWKMSTHVQERKT
jgi:hypothetical protein